MTRTAPEIVWSEDVAADLRGALAVLGAERVVVLAHPSRRFVDAIRPGLGELPVAIVAEARAHVPAEAVERAAERVREHGADTLVAVGGGSAIGLGKALLLEHDLRFVAVPTTYAGSEQTDVYGVRRAGEKRTGRDPRVCPDVVLYAPALLAKLSPARTAQSLVNALAHPIGGLTSGSLTGDDRDDALATADELLVALENLAEAPGHAAYGRDALRAAARAGAILQRGALGAHHRLAHRLGGRFDLEHAAVHSALLPHTLRALQDDAPELFSELSEALRVPDLPGLVFDLLRRAGAPTSLSALGVDADAADALVAHDPELPAEVIRRALEGGRASARVRYEDWGLAHPVRLAGPAPKNARAVAVALHGRGSNASDFVKRLLEISGDAPDVAIVAPQAPRNRWYPKPYTARAAEHGEDLEAALAAVDAVVERASDAASAERVFVVGFSQGACLAAEYAARTERRLAGLLALSGARIGPADEQPTPSRASEGMPVLLGASEADPWIRAADVEHTATCFREAGARVDVLMTPGDGHALTAMQRARARELLTGKSVRAVRAGFGNTRESEALPGALPLDRNSPRRAPYGLYAEQLNATGFTASRQENRRAWLYRIRPSAQHTPFEPLPHPRFGADFQAYRPEPNLAGWKPLALPDEPTDFVDGLATVGGAGSPEHRRGFAIHVYAANRSMEERALADADGELLLVPELGRLSLWTELGVLDVEPGEIAIVPRGVRFSVMLRDPCARGYLAEIYGRSFRLPERGPVGANALTEARHFRAPVAYHEDRLAPGYRLTSAYLGRLFEARQDTSPYDVVAHHGNLSPYTYDLAMFAPVGNVRVDHADPSIFTVLSAPLDEQGAHNLDFVVFPERTDVTEGTFRPPFFHRNAVTELNGIVREPGATGDTAFRPGGYFLTPSMTPHGVRARIVERALAMSDAEADAPMRLGGRSLWFQFETMLPMALTSWAAEADNRLRDWHLTFGAYRTHYHPDAPGSSG